MAATNSVTMEFPSFSQNVGFARTAVAMFASQLDFTLDEIDEIKVATSEAVSNAVVHAYEGGVGSVRLTVSLENGTLVVVVEDQGRGIPDVAWASEATHTTSPADHMGLGLVFIKEYMNEVKVESEQGKGTRVRMSKVPAQASAATDGGTAAGNSGRH